MRKNIVLFVNALSLLALLGGCAATNSASPRFVDLGNGICQDTETGAMWQMERSKTITSIEDARQYAAGVKLGGYADWRLPTVDELYSFIHLKDDMHVASSCDITLDGNFWSDAHNGEGEGMAGAWEVGEQCGPSRVYEVKTRGYVRAIRP